MKEYQVLKLCQTKDKTNTREWKWARHHFKYTRILTDKTSNSVCSIRSIWDLPFWGGAGVASKNKTKQINKQKPGKSKEKQRRKMIPLQLWHLSSPSLISLTLEMKDNQGLQPSATTMQQQLCHCVLIGNLRRERLIISYT